MNNEEEFYARRYHRYKILFGDHSVQTLEAARSYISCLIGTAGQTDRTGKDAVPPGKTSEETQVPVKKETDQKWKYILSLQQECFRIACSVYGEKTVEAFAELRLLGRIYMKMERKKDGLFLLERLYKMQAEVLGEDHTDSCRTLGDLVNGYVEQRSWEDAARYQEILLRIKEKQLHGTDPDLLADMNAAGVLLANAGKNEEALHFLNGAAIKWKRIEGVRRQSFAEHDRVLKNLAIVYDRMGRFERSWPRWYLLWRRKRAEDERKELNELSDSLLTSLKKCVEQTRTFIPKRKGTPGGSRTSIPEPVEMVEELYRSFDSFYGKNSPETLRCLEILVLAYEAAGKRGQAVFYQKMLADRYRETDDDSFGSALAKLALLYAGDGDRKRAVSTAQEAIRILLPKMEEDRNAEAILKMRAFLLRESRKTTAAPFSAGSDGGYWQN